MVMSVTALVSSGKAAGEEGVIRFEDVSAKAGMAMKPRVQHPDVRIAQAQRNFEDVYATGYLWNIQDVCFADVNGDGNLDVFLLNEPHGCWSRLWLGNGKGGFAEFNSEKMPRRYISPSPAWRLLPFDFRGSGAQDLIITSCTSRDAYGARVFHGARLNCVTPGEADPAKLRLYGSYSSTAGFTHLLADFDGDGTVDIAAGVDLDSRGSVGGTGLVFPGILTHGEWELDRTETPLPIGTQCVAADFDKDGLTDILSRGHWAQVHLLKNGGRRAFLDQTSGSGLETMPGGGPVAVADFNNDGLPDIFCSGVGGRDASGKDIPGGVRLYLNQGGGKFKDATQDSGLIPPGKTQWTQRFGTATVGDFNNDGLPEILVCDGDVNRLYLNLGGGKFKDVTKESGLIEAVMPESSNAAGDFDNDGRVDVLVVTRDKGVGLFHNISRNGNNWVKVRLKGPKGNPDSAGARATVFEAGRVGQAGAVIGYQESIFSTDFRMPRPLHFGLGTRAGCDVRVQFPGGKTVDKTGVQAGTLLTLSEE